MLFREADVVELVAVVLLMMVGCYVAVVVVVNAAQRR